MDETTLQEKAVTDSAEKLLRECSIALDGAALQSAQCDDGDLMQKFSDLRDRIRAHLSAQPVTGQGDANGGWISVADRKLPYHNQAVRFEVASGSIFDGHYEAGAFPRFVRKDEHGSYTYKVVNRWQPLPAAPMTAASVTDERE